MIKHITHEKMLTLLDKPDLQDKHGTLSVSRMWCEWFLLQEMANGNLPYNFGGHNRGYREYGHTPNGDWDTTESRLRDMYLFSDVIRPAVDTEQLKSIVRAYMAQEKLPEPVQVYRGGKHDGCRECDQAPMLFTDGLRMWNPFTCAFPNGAPEYYYDFDFPSGKIVIENDSRHLFPAHAELGGNGTVWEMRITGYYAKLGMAHFFVGNTCPSVWEVGEDEYQIAPTPQDKDYEDIPHNWGAPKAGIMTDLWWYSIMDYNKYIELGGKIAKYHCDVMEITPGRYRFTHQQHLVRDVGGLEEIYTKITKIT